MPSTAPDPVHVGVGVLWRGGQVLVARRPTDSHQGGLLELPGGKREPGEGLPQTLSREFMEEVGVRVEPAHWRPLIQIPHDYGDKQVLLDVWEAHRFEGEPAGREGQPVYWQLPTDLRDSDFPAANRPILRALRLPSFLCISPLHATAEDLLTRLSGWSPSAGRALLLRLPETEDRAYLDRARQLLAGADCPVLLHGDPGRLEALPQAAGLHLPEALARNCRHRPVSNDHWLGVSCHSPESLQWAREIGADYALLSPVRHTASHPQARPLGWRRFAEWVSNVPLPVYALGGMHRRDLACARECGGQGVAGISLWR